MLTRSSNIMALAAGAALIVALLTMPQPGSVDVADSGRDNTNNSNTAWNEIEPEAVTHVESLLTAFAQQMKSQPQSQGHDEKPRPQVDRFTRDRRPSRPGDHKTLQRDQLPKDSRLPSELIDRCMEVAFEVDAELGTQLQALREQKPEQFEQLMRQGEARRLLALAQLKQRDPHLYRIKITELSQEVQIRRVVREYHDAVAREDASRANVLRKQLETLVQMQLVQEITTRGEYIIRLEEELRQLREELEDLCENFQTVLEQRLESQLQQYDTAAAAADDDDVDAADAELAAMPKQP